MMNSTAADDDSAILLNNLLPALAEIFIITLMGWACVRFDAIPVEYGTALGRFAGYYALPSIILVNMSQIKLGDASIGLILSMLVAKVSVASLVGGMGYVLLPAPLDPSKAPRNWSMCACFSMLCVSSNDFALGLPILDAIYPPEEGMLSMRDYLFLFSPITLAITTPAAFAVLELAAAVTKQHANGDTDTAESAVGCGFLLKQVLLPTLMSPVVYCVVLGLLINVAPGIELPGFAVGTLSTLGSAFAPLSLFALGMSMADKQTEGLEEEEEAAAAGELDSKDDGSGGPWVQTLLLIGAKSLGLPLVARFLALAFTGNEDLSRFAFVYATFPPSSQTYLFAQRFNLDVGDLKRIARPTVVGTVVAAPIMFAAAEMTQIELTFDPSDPNPEGGQQVQALTLAEQVGYASLVMSFWVVMLTLSMLCSCRKPPPVTAAAHGVPTVHWRRQHLVWSVFFLASTQVAYLSLATICSPKWFRNTYGLERARQCSLGVEGMAMASRLWSVIIVISDIHRVYRAGADPEIDSNRCFWKFVKCMKVGYLWIAWALPAVWVSALWGSGLWERLGLSCWGCVNFDPVVPPPEPEPDDPPPGSDEDPPPPAFRPRVTEAAREYNILSAALVLVLATTAMAALIWEHRKRNANKLKRLRLASDSRTSSPARDFRTGGGDIGISGVATDTGATMAAVAREAEAAMTMSMARAALGSPRDRRGSLQGAVGSPVLPTGSDSSLHTLLLDAHRDSGAASDDGRGTPMVGDDGAYDGATGAFPIWSSVALRMVGLCNVFGLVFQIGVGIGAIAGGDFLLEIAALNHFGLFVQGIATGLLLGWVQEAPLVCAVQSVAIWLRGIYRRCVDCYEDPRMDAQPSLPSRGSRQRQQQRKSIATLHDAAISRTLATPISVGGARDRRHSTQGTAIPIACSM